MDTIRDITIKTFKAHSVAFESPTFKAFYDLGYRVVAVKDLCYNLADLLGDSYNPTVNSGIPAVQLKKEETAEKRRINKLGVWGCGLALDDKPVYDTFIWGFVGDDFIGSGHDSGLLELLATKVV